MDRGKSLLKQYVITALMLFFFVILLFNLFRTYSKYISALSKVKNIQTLLSSVNNQNKALKKEYTYYRSNYYKNKVASNDLNLAKGTNIYEYSIPKSTNNSYINLSKNSHTNHKNKKPRTSFLMWINLLF